MKTSILLSALLLALAANTASAQAAPGSSPLEYTYRIDSVAGAGYRATLTAFHGPFQYRDMPMTPQGCGASAGSPVSSAAELIVFVQPTGPIHAKFRAPSTSGGSCEFVTEFDLKAEDRPPSTQEVDPEMPGQGQKPRMKEVPEILDLSAADPVRIGRTMTQWGGVAVIPASQAVLRRNGTCYFPYSYLSINAGPGHAEGSSNALTLGAPDGPLLALDDLAAQLPMSAATVSGRIGLPSGLSLVVLEIDAPGYVPETIAYNNVRRVMVDVTGSCY
ncbi:MAG TPA: hypothetical protein VLF18_11455 [Tahibacter sp.]|uniref:hypothetical protein n=1 Tax=Tahibacter sp. TaxID=2056211 RepID=UPI002BB21815|nr:hypothetical protein [Tahibacter sp.]HSX60806.1 hypothetical protein [Tahibacter sp.]